MLGLRAQWLVAQCLDIAPDSRRRDAWILHLKGAQCSEFAPNGGVMLELERPMAAQC
jgi:hypothetical protein